MSKSIPQLRNFPSWREEDIFPTISLKTAISIEKELWIMLCSYSEVKKRGIELVKSNSVSPSDANATWIRFKSYIGQAKNYWNTASLTSYESSSLSYYYSFLNLVKAFLVLKDSNLPHDVYHGLSYKTTDSSSRLNDKMLTSHSGAKEAFSIYYEEVFSEKPPKSFKVVSLLGYPLDISYQYMSGGFGSRKSFPFVYRIAIDPSRKKAWLVLALPSVAPIKYHKNSFPIFFDEFEQTLKPNTLGPGFRDMFNFKSQDWTQYDFYQSKINKEIDFVGDQILTGILVQKIKDSFGEWLSPNYYGDEHSGYINFPKNKAELSPMNEEIAIYELMFFMSDVVRYRPDYLDKILDSKAAWLLESFVETCPLKFLRAITSRIIGKTVVISSF
ncbi:MAG TPA: YaaC family protein [Candidatus Saccharimonadales bacterium]|nr:YaaC family protein [Candidatus Saccharimonadales bacterium]